MGLRNLFLPLVMMFSLLVGSVGFAATAPMTCSFSLSGSQCILSGDAKGGNNLTGNHKDPFLNSSVGEGFTFIGEFTEGEFWKHDSETSLLNLESDFSFAGYSQIALGIKQTSKWDVFLVDLSLGEYTFNVNDISNIKVYGMQGVYETPLPAAAWLFLTGLAGLGWMKKRKHVRALTA